MLVNIIYSVKNNLINSFNINHFWKHIYFISLTNKQLYESCKTILIPLYVYKIKNIYQYTHILLPPYVLSYIYPKQITYSYNPIKFILPSREEIDLNTRE